MPAEAGIQKIQPRRHGDYGECVSSPRSPCLRGEKDSGFPRARERRGMDGRVSAGACAPVRPAM